MRKILALSVLLAATTAAAHADILEVSGFGGYTTVGMKDVNNQINGQKANGFTTTDLSNGYVAGLDVRTGLLFPIPFFSIGPRVEFLGTNTGEAKSSLIDEKIVGNMVDGMLGLNFKFDIPVVGIGIGAGVYGGYGEGVMQQTYSNPSLGIKIPDYYRGGNFVGEAELRLSKKLFTILNIYAFGGYRVANLGTFKDGASQQLFQSGNVAVDFSGVTGGLGLNLDF